MTSTEQKTIRRTAFVATVLLSLFGLWPSIVAADTTDEEEKRAWSALRSGAIALLRHADAPGFGDPPGFMLGNCSTQRNLGDVIISILLVWLASFIAAIAGMLGFIALLVGALITIPAATLWQYLVQSHLFGQIAAKDRASNLAEVEDL